MRKAIILALFLVLILSVVSQVFVGSLTDSSTITIKKPTEITIEDKYIGTSPIQELVKYSVDGVSFEYAQRVKQGDENDENSLIRCEDMYLYYLDKTKALSINRKIDFVEPKYTLLTLDNLEAKFSEDDIKNCEIAIEELNQQIQVLK